MRTGFWTILGATAAILFLSAALFRWSNEPKRSATPDDQRIVLYCAAGIMRPVAAAAEAYEREEGVRIELEYGGSNTLLARIEAARRGDLYLAADHDYIELARQKGLLAESLPLATQSAAIAVPKGNPHGIESLESLLNPKLRIGLANPDAAAVGRIGRTILEKAGLWQEIDAAVEERGVYKPTVPDLANDLKLGHVDVAILWDTTIAQYPELEGIPIPDELNVPQHIEIGVLTTSRQPTEALRFARYLAARDRGLVHFEQERYQVVDGDIWDRHPRLVLHCGGVLRPAVERAIAEFQQREGVDVDTIYNGCGILVAQIRAGDRPDLYFACDRSFMEQVAEYFLESRDICRTDIIICVPPGNPRGIQSVDDLIVEGLKVGVCNPQQSALGALTKELLERTGHWDRVLPQVVAQTPTADLLIAEMRTGHLDAAIVFTANQYRVREHLDAVPLGIAEGDAVQPLAIGRESPHKYLVGRLIDALVTAESQGDFETAGFEWLVRGESAATGTL